MTEPRRALIVVDVQNEYFDGPLAIQHPPRDESLAKIQQAIDTAEEAGLPIAMIEHQFPEGFPVFAPGTEGQRSHSEIDSRAGDSWHRITKNYSSVFPETDLADWLRENNVDTITLAGFMTNNCILATSVDAEPRGINVEVLSDATGAINLSNAAGSVPAKQVHETLMALLNSNFAAVGTTDAWNSAVNGNETLPGSDLVSSATGK